ncbi:MAG TPA: c-type cytochrome [Vicinamibacterales bacterium]
MKRYAGVLIVGLLAAVAAGIGLGAQAQEAPDWAYGYLKPVAPGDTLAPPCPETAKPFPDCAFVGAPVPDDGVKHKLAGTDRTFTRNEAYFDYGPADWYPEDHPPMPDIVAKGKQAQGTRACALCHYPNGQGKMENGHVAGLPAAYILQQLDAFKTGARRSADPRKANTNEMAGIARSLTDEEAKAAAAYFSSMKWRPWVRVIESDTAPAVRSTMNGLFLAIPNAAPVPLGQRIIVVAEHPERTDTMRDPRAGFVAYVPVGSVARGEAIATTGAGKTVQCGLCHGKDLMGMKDVPGIAGRTPTYTMRQLWDIQKGTRTSPQMAPVVAKLTLEDMLNVTAYLASQTVSVAGSQ